MFKLCGFGKHFSWRKQFTLTKCILVSDVIIRLFCISIERVNDSIYMVAILGQNELMEICFYFSCFFFPKDFSNANLKKKIFKESFCLILNLWTFFYVVLIGDDNTPSLFYVITTNIIKWCDVR